MINILTDLNDAQKEAVQTIEGPLLIIAGAGSGKTKALTHRLAHLIEKGISPKNILALTFTNKAAEEMKKRVFQLVGPVFQYSKKINLETDTGPFLGTFHSLGAKILRQEIKLLGRENNFTIYDDGDSLSLVKEAMAELGIDMEQFRAGGIYGIISKQKNELVEAQEYSENAKEIYEKIAAKAFIKYEEYLRESNALDFDDLLTLSVKLFKKYPDVLEKYQNLFRYILVDEYQDTNTSQYILLSLLAQKYKNLCVVGDDWQCLPPTTKILTADGPRPIELLTTNQKVFSANGAGVTSQKVNQTKKFDYKGNLIKITTSSGKEIKATPNHIFFTRFKLNPSVYFVYLMYATRVGYRIGIAKGARSDGRKMTIGLQVRANQERADKMWVLKIAESREEAVLQEQLLSVKYGVPTMVFSAYKNRKMKLSQELIDQLYREIPTHGNAEKLMSEFNINPNYPHFLPQGTTRKDSGEHKIRVNLTLFGDPRISQASPWGLSRLAINTSHSNLKNVLQKQGWPIRKGKLGTWRIECSRLRYSDAENLANKICSIAQEHSVPVELKRTACLVKGTERYVFQPASHLRPTMALPIVKDGIVHEEEILKVETESYNGAVYDIDVENTHNYIANGIVVHNSIYAFRGADFRNILRFEKDYPQAKIVFLEENYRSTQNILDAAHAIIEKNVYKTQKRLWTRKSRGDRIKIVQAYSETDEAGFIVEEINRTLAEGKIAADLNNFAILYRTNAQSRAIEEAVLEEGWSYRMVGALKFYERKEVKDALGYLRFIQNNKDLISLKRIINTPPRGIGKASWEKIQSSNDLDIINSPKIADFTAKINEFKVLSNNKKVSDLIKLVLEKTGYKNFCIDGTSEGETRWENLQELISVSYKFDELPPPHGLQNFLEEVSLTTSTDNISDERGELNLMTLHSAKGLEFPVVFMAGAEEGLLPHSKSQFDSQQMEEERRLCYVGLTRAKEKAYLIFTKRRNLYGQSQTCLPSRFLGDIPPHLVDFMEYEEGGNILEI